MHKLCFVGIFLGIGVVACSGDPESNSTGAAGAGGETASSSVSSSTSSSSGGGGGAGGGVSQDVPATPDELFAFLQAKSYAGFAHESAPHVSTGPHGGKVQTYLNAPLFASLQAMNAEHPAGSAVIKELYDTTGTMLTGWAATIKTQDASDGGNGFYWYEIYSTTDGSNPPYAGQGLTLCTGCHAAGKDYVMTPFPLQ